MKISLLLGCLLTISQIGRGDDIAMKIVRVHGDAGLLAKLGCVAGVDCSGSNALGAIILKGLTTRVTQAEQTIKDLDALSPTPDLNSKKNIETTIYVLSGSTEPIQEAPEITGEPLASVVMQLRPIFPYAHYQSVGSMMLRSTDESDVISEGMLRSANAIPNFSVPAHYKITYRAQTSAGQSRSIHFKDLAFAVQTPYVSSALKNGNGSAASTQYQQGNIFVKADIDVREGQKVVVGKANVSDNDTCFFIVVSARMVP